LILGLVLTFVLGPAEIDSATNLLAARLSRGEPSPLVSILRALDEALCPRVYALDDQHAVSVQRLHPPEPSPLDEGLPLVALSHDSKKVADSSAPKEVVGLYYFRNRYLDPVEGRFVNRDPIGVWGDPENMGNGYAFCAGNPVSGRDPFGLGLLGTIWDSTLGPATGVSSTDIANAWDQTVAPLTGTSSVQASAALDKAVATAATKVFPTLVKVAKVAETASVAVETTVSDLTPSNLVEGASNTLWAIAVFFTSDTPDEQKEVQKSIDAWADQTVALYNAAGEGDPQAIGTILGHLTSAGILIPGGGLAGDLIGEAVDGSQAFMSARAAGPELPGVGELDLTTTEPLSPRARIADTQALMNIPGLEPTDAHLVYGAGGTDTLAPGPHANPAGSVLATGPRVTEAQSNIIQGFGRQYGCHTCGKKRAGGPFGTFIGDHQPPTALALPGSNKFFILTAGHVATCRGDSANRGQDATRREEKRRDARLRAAEYEVDEAVDDDRRSLQRALRAARRRRRRGLSPAGTPLRAITRPGCSCTP